MLLFALFASSLLYGTVRAPAAGWSGTGTLAALLVSALALIAFALRQRASDHPILDLALLRRPAFTAALIAIFVGMFTAYGFMAYTSIWLQSLTGLSPLRAGLVILPGAVASMAVSVMAGHWLRRFLPRYSLPVALLLVAAGALAQTGLTGHVTDPRATAQQLAGGGAHEITTQAPAAGRSALEHLLRTAFVHGLNTAALIGAILALAAAVITALALRRETPSHAEPRRA